METRANYVVVGTFVLAMVVLAFAAVLWFGRAELTTQYVRYDIYFTGPVSGLRVGAAVEYAGVPVGKVAEIRIERNGPHPDKPIRVTVDIDQSTRIESDADAAVETNILSGVSYIQITSNLEAGQVATPLQPAAGRPYPEIRSHRSRFASVAARLPQLLEKADEAMDHVNELLNEKNRQAVAETLENIRTFSGGLAEQKQAMADLVADADKAMRAASTLVDNVDQSYVGPDGLGERTTKALADFDSLANNLSDTNRQLQAALQDMRPGIHTFTQQTLGDVGALVGDARRLIAELNRLTDQIARNPSQVLFGDRREGYHLK